MRPYSPLRYPGGKARFYPIVQTLLERNRITITEYIEPYAGGAGLALALLMEERVSAIHINDIDPSIYAFWQSVLEHTKALCYRIRSARLTPDEWWHQRSIQQNPTSASTVELGFSTLYLNRTNRSGIIKRAGMIGGPSQNGHWRMDVRFNKDTLIERVKTIASKRSRINIYNLDAIDFLENVHLGRRALTYLDPPYFSKGRRLYTNYYDSEDHVEIARYVQDKLRGYWILSYDDVKEIRGLYDIYRKRRVIMRYTAATKRDASEIVIFSDAFPRLVRLPRVG